MKKGKSVKLNLFNPIKSMYGTVDSKNLKSVFINIQSWVTPKQEMENWGRVVGNLNRQIKHSVFDSNKSELFLTKTIIDLDLRVSGICTGKKSFFNLEVNLFANEQLDFKSDELKKEIRTIIKSIYQNNIEKNKYFLFSKSKK